MERERERDVYRITIHQPLSNTVFPRNVICKVCDLRLLHWAIHFVFFFSQWPSFTETWDTQTKQTKSIPFPRRSMDLGDWGKCRSIFHGKYGFWWWPGKMVPSGSLGTSAWITWRFCWQNEWDMTGGSSQFLAEPHSWLLSRSLW